LFFEGYFSLNHTRMGPAQDLFGQLWKEYAFSDSRYLTSDPFVLCMETVTAVCFPPLNSPSEPQLTTQFTYGEPISNLTGQLVVYMGAYLLRCSLFHHKFAPAPPSSPNHRLCWPDLRFDPLLCNQHVRSLLCADHLLETRVFVFLGILLLHELHLDGFPWQ
jgi:cholestenol Delta-isomerase